MDVMAQMLIEHSCRKLSVDYARYLDFREYDKFTDLFSEDGFLFAGVPLRGRAEIAAGMCKRSDKLRSRHVLSNIHTEVIDDDHARGVSYLTLYRHIGPESLGSEPIGLSIDGPAGVGHYRDEFIRTDAGWRFSRRELEFAFQNAKAFPAKRDPTTKQ